MAKNMENQSQWDKICTSDFYHPQKDMPSNLERLEDSSSRGREVFGTTSRRKSTYSAKTIWNSTEQDVLDARQQNAAVDGK